MDRTDLEKARAALPQLEPIWQARRARLESERDHTVYQLDQRLDAGKADDGEMADVYRNLIRIDRSLWFLDRALLHLDDLEREQPYAARIPLSLRAPQASAPMA